MGAFFLLAPAANHAWYKSIFYWLHETAACCFFGVDLRNGLDHYSLSHGRDSSLLFRLALLYSPSPFLLGQFISSPTPFLPFAFLAKNCLSPIPLLSLLLTKIFQVQLQFYKKIRRQFQILS